MQNTATMKFNELEWRTDAVRASAGKIISHVATQSKLALIHYGLLLDLRTINGQMVDLLRFLHSPESIAILEASSQEERGKLGSLMFDVHNKVRVTICRMRALELGYWRHIYAPRFDKLEAANTGLAAHADAFRNTDSALIILGHGDQDFILESLVAPDEPNDALRRAFMR